MHWTRSALALACALVTLLTLTGSAFAGGWAVTTIDALPEGGFQAGQTYRLGFWIRQHGQHPFAGAKPSFQITSAESGERRAFPGHPDGEDGHYVVEVTFPAEGEWSWEVSQDPFSVQSLGTVSVAAATVESGEVAQTTSLGSLGLPLALVSVFLVAIGAVTRVTRTPVERAG
jgi:hypothetical protein